METELIHLLKFADESIGRYITFYLTGMGALAVFVMTEGYKRNFKPLGKVVLSISLSVLAFGDWAMLVYYQQIYNETVVAIQQAAIGTDLASVTALQPKELWYIYGGHAVSGLVGLSLIWWMEVQTTIRKRILIRWRNWKSRRKQLTGR